MADLRNRGFVTKVRKLKSGVRVGGIPYTRGPLAHLLRNRFDYEPADSATGPSDLHSTARRS